MLNRNRALLIAGVLLAIALGFATACGGGDDDGATPTATPTAAAAPTESETPADTGDQFEEQSFSVGQEFWHSGFHVFLGDATLAAEEDEISGEVTYTLTIEAVFENLGPDQEALTSTLVLIAGADNYTPRSDSELPSVPSGLSNEGTFVFEVDEGIDLDSAYVLVGTGGQTKARVPLGTQGGEIVDLAPGDLALSGGLTMELIDLDFTSAEVRADIPASYSEVDEGKVALTLNFDATSRKSGNWSINPQDFALILPSGNAIGADGAELASLPGNDSGIDTTGLYVRFLIDRPPAGEYTLRFTPGSWWLSNGGPEEATFTFELP